MSKLKVRDLMTTQVVTLKPDDNLKKAVIKLALDNVSGAPVVDNRNHLLGILSESLAFSDTGVIEILPCLPNSGFDAGEITGIRARTRALINDLKWDTAAGTASVTVTSDIAQTIEISCGLSGETQSIAFAAGETKTIEFTF